MTIDDDIFDCLNAELRDQISPDQLPALASRVANRLRAKLGGERIYIGKRRADARRTQQLRAHWTGNNVPELCQRFGLSRPQIYRIVGKKQKK